MNDADLSKLNFIKTNIQASVLVDVLYTIDKSELKKCLDSVPDAERDSSSYKILLHISDFYEKVSLEQQE